MPNYEVRPGVHALLQLSEGGKYVIATLDLGDVYKKGQNVDASKGVHIKRECDLSLGEDGLTRLSPGMFSWVSGGRKENETAEGAMRREIREEIGLANVSLKSASVPNTYTLQERKPGKVVVLEGSAYVAQLSDRELKAVEVFLLPQGRKLQVLEIAELWALEPGVLRPFAQAAIKLLNDTYVTTLYA